LDAPGIRNQALFTGSLAVKTDQTSVVIDRVMFSYDTSGFTHFFTQPTLLAVLGIDPKFEQ
jgi:hypothetical protein